MDSAKGELITGSYSQSAVMPGMDHAYALYIPAGYGGEAACVYVNQDGLLAFVPELFEELIAAGEMPLCLGVFIAPGVIHPTLPGGFERSVRCPQYDGLGTDYADFLLDELLPYLEETHGVRFSRNPDDRAIGGCSSGGICAFNAAWARPAGFRRVYMNSPTFCAFRGGDSLPMLVRKVETRPQRCYMTVGTDDMRNAAGDWHLEALRMNEALKYAGYEFEFQIFEGGPHGVGWGDPETFRTAMRYLWRGYPEGITVKALPERVADIIDLEHGWEELDRPAAPPSAAAVPAPPQAVAAAISCDRWRVYYLLPGSRFVFAASLLPGGGTADPYRCGWLHAPDDGAVAASSLAVDVADRLLVGTAMGIQVIDNTGHTNAILPLPGDLPVTRLWFGGPELNFLYAASGDRVFRRRSRTAGFAAASPILEPTGQGL